MSGRVLVPIRMVSEALGFDVLWYQDTQTVTVNREGETYPTPQVAPGSVHLVISGQEVHPDVPPQNINGRVMVPIRVIAEAFGLEATWNQTAQAVLIGNLGPVVKVSFIDVGQGDSILLELPGGTNILVDGGPEGAGSTVLSYLAQEKVTELAYVVVTHPHADHIAGLDEVIEGITVKAVLLPSVSATTQDYADLMAAISAQGVEPTQAEAGTYLLDTEDLEVAVLGPVGISDDLNNDSVFLRVSYGQVDFLLMGDAEFTAETDLIRSGQSLSAEVLKVGHHGSTSSTSAFFLQRVDLDYAVISVGATNSYGHPKAETLTALANAGAMVFRTDTQGTVIATATESVVLFNLQPSQVSATTGEGTTGGAGGSTTVYVTGTGTKYHRAGCRFLSHSCIPISLADAKAAGYTPCSVCDPPK